MKSLSGMNVVITGGASGIGKEMALLFAKEKARVAILDVDRPKLRQVEKEIKGLKAKVFTYVCDVSDRKKIERTVKLLSKDLKSVDILVNNAGIAVGKTIADSTHEEIQKIIDVNLMGVIWMTKALLPKMMRRKKGHIVNIASAAGMLAIPKLADYCTTKFGVIGFSDSLRMEMKKFGYKGIKVTCVCPSIIDTGMFEGFTPPLLSPLLKPEVVAAKVIMAVKKERSYLKTPFMVKLIPLFKFLPATFVDWLGDILGTSRAMDHFKGR